MRADIHDGPEHNTLQAEAGYIDARPYLPDRRNLLQHTAGPYIRVKGVDLAALRSCLVPSQLTRRDELGLVGMGQNRAHD